MKDDLHKKAERIEAELGLSSPDLLSEGLSARRTTQFRCIERFRRAESKRQKKELKFNDAFRAWDKKGYDVLFGKFYDSNKDYTESAEVDALYRAIVHPLVVRYAR